MKKENLSDMLFKGLFLCLLIANVQIVMGAGTWKKTIIVSTFDGTKMEYLIDKDTKIKVEKPLFIIETEGTVINLELDDMQRIEYGKKYVPSDDDYVSVSIGSNGKTTFCGDKDLDFSGFEDLKAFIATGFDKESGTIWLTRVKDVPAGVPVMIKGEADKSYEVPISGGGSSYYKNMFKGNTSGETVVINETEEDGKYQNYYMKGGQFVSVKGTAKIGNYKCYLRLPANFEAESTGESLKVKIAASGKSSFAAPYDLDFTDFGDDLKAFTATGYDKGTKTIWLTRVMKVQKGEGLLLKGTGGETYTIPSSGIQASYMNMFVGNTSGGDLEVGEKSADGEWTNNYLKSGTYMSVVGNVNIGNNKSYLQLPTEMLAAARGSRGGNTEYGFMEAETIKMTLNHKGGLERFDETDSYDDGNLPFKWENETLYLDNLPDNTLIEVYATDGKLVKGRHYNGSAQLSLRELAYGVYIVKINQNNIYKIIKR